MLAAQMDRGIAQGLEHVFLAGGLLLRLSKHIAGVAVHGPQANYDTGCRGWQWSR